jgi:hypothetical protein
MTIEARYGVPSVAVHTDKFDRVVRSVAAVNGMPWFRQVFVPQPVMGKTARELRACVDGADPLTGRPVMQEVVEGLTRPLDDEGLGPMEFDRSAPRLVEPDTEEPPAPVSREPLDGLPGHRATDGGAGGGDAGQDPAQARRDRRPHAPDPVPRGLGVHGREGRRERGDGRSPAGVLPGDPDPGRHRRERTRQHDQLGGHDGRRQRTDPSRDRHERRHRRDGAPQPRQRHDRAGLRPAVAEPPGRLGARGHLQLARRATSTPTATRPSPRTRSAAPGNRSTSSTAPGRQRREPLHRLPLHRVHARSSRAALARARPNMFRGMDTHSPPTLLLDPITARASSSTAAASARRTRSSIGSTTWPGCRPASTGLPARPELSLPARHLRRRAVGFEAQGRAPRAHPDAPARGHPRGGRGGRDQGAGGGVRQRGPGPLRE